MPHRRPILLRVRFGARRAFTLIEMLVVIAVIVVVLAILTPSVARLMRSTNYASAINAVTATLGRARAAAMESGQPTAVAFLFDIKTKQYTLQTLELAPAGDTGSLWAPPPPDNPNCGEDLSTSGASRAPNSAVVYQALRFSAPIELPPGMGVFGLSQMIPEIDALTRDAGGFSSLDQDQDSRIDPIAESNSGAAFDMQQWYAGEIINDANNTNPSNEDNIIPWIFPHNDPRLYLNKGDDPWLIMSGVQTTGDLNEARAAVRHSMSFAVAFRPDGSVSTSFGSFASLIKDAYIEFPDQPRDELADPPNPYDRPNVFDPGCLHPDTPNETRPNPEVRLRTVSQLAVVDLRSLEAGAGVNEPWLVRADQDRSLAPIPSNSNDPKMRFLDDSLVVNMSRWIDENAQIIGFNRYTGETVKR